MRAHFMVAALAFAGPVVAHAQTAQPSITFVHGIAGHDVSSTLIPDLPVDVAIDGICVKFGATFGTVSGPYALADGNHSVAVSFANATAPCSGTVALSTTVALTRGGQQAIVAQETSSGIALTQFGLSQSLAVPTGQTRFLVVHAANAPAVDVALTSTTKGAARTIKGLTPGQSAVATTAAFLPYQTLVYPAGTATPVAGPLTLRGDGRAVVAAFVVGSAANGTVTIAYKQIPGVF